MVHVFSASRTYARVVLTAVLFGFIAPVAAAQDATRFQVDFFENGSDVPMNEATVWVSDRRVRIEQSPRNSVQQKTALIYRGDRDLVMSVSDASRTYAQIDRKMLSLLGLTSGASSSKAARRVIDGQLKGLPADQRRALERMLGVSREETDVNANPTIVSRETEQGEVGGFACTQVDMTRGEASVGKACIAPWSRLGLNASDIEVFRALANFHRDALAARGVTPIEFVPNQAYDLIAQFDGMPLSFGRSVEGKPRSAIRVRSIDHVRSTAALFEAPEGYARTTGYEGFAAHFSPSSAASTETQTTFPAAPAPVPTAAKATPARPAPKAKVAPKRARRTQREGLSLSRKKEGFAPITLFP